MTSDLRRAILQTLGAGEAIRPDRSTLSDRQRLAVDVENAIAGAQQIKPRAAVVATKTRPPDLTELERVIADTRKLG